MSSGHDVICITASSDMMNYTSIKCLFIELEDRESAAMLLVLRGLY